MDGLCTFRNSSYFVGEMGMVNSLQPASQVGFYETPREACIQRATDFPLL